QTGLANEEVFQGRCDRCETPIEKKSLKQWMLRITAYADRLLKDLEGADWPHSTMLMQKNWIGRSDGAEVDFELPGLGGKLTVFTTRPDTLYGATYLVLAPEHPLVAKLTTPAQKTAVDSYVAAVAGKSDLERTEPAKDKTGVFTGAYAVNPVNGEKLPVWTADYVLTTYGAGAIMAVPAHDQRDWEFAKKFGLKVIEVVKTPDCWKHEEAWSETGTAVNSPIIDGLETPEAGKKMTAWLEEKGIGRTKVNFKLRDWVFSRQRYWGEPIPIVHCPKCGAEPVPEKDLPLLLPEVEKYLPTGTGESPLAAIESWVNTSCPACGGPAKRETNTMPQWAGSCWYYLRFIDPKNPGAFVSKELEKAWMPVDLYIGGAEHAVLHLLYARFWHKALFDLGLVSTGEPFKKLVHPGMILACSYRDAKGVYHGYKELAIAEDGSAKTPEGETIKPVVEKMSKSRKNVINPDEILKRYGADAFRLYEMFLGPLEDSKPWDLRAIEGVYRFLRRAYAWGLERHTALTDARPSGPDMILRHQTIEKVGADIEALKFNTAISALMIYLNRLTEQKETSREDFNIFLTLLHPFAPHITDELWELSGGETTLMRQAWPPVDKAVIASRDIEIPVQVNGKIKERLKVKETTSQEEIKRLALEAVAPHTAGKALLKVIVVPGRLVSIAVK
ncbi:MAG: leucine--tRNA ligase, partial [Elusimicrobiota bacterium]